MVNDAWFKCIGTVMPSKRGMSSGGTRRKFIHAWLIDRFITSSCSCIDSLATRRGCWKMLRHQGNKQKQSKDIQAMAEHYGREYITKFMNKKTLNVDVNAKKKKKNFSMTLSSSELSSKAQSYQTSCSSEGGLGTPHVSFDLMHFSFNWLRAKAS